MIIHDCVQGTTEWLWLRAGIPTASNFEKICTPKGEKSKQDEKYMFQLLAERMIGHPIEGYTSRFMERGSHTEADAVNFYELTRDVETFPIGFITNDSETVGASPDRGVKKTENKGLLEIKCPSEAIHVSYLMQAGSVYDEYKVQCQGQLWVAEAEWVDLVSYHPEMPEALVRIRRDDIFIKKLSDHVTKFSQTLETNALLLKQRGWITTQEKKPREQTAGQIMREVLLETMKGTS